MFSLLGCVGLTYWKRFIMLVFVLAGPVACSTTTIHLNTRYLSDSQATQLVNNIKQSGMEVETNQHEFPHSIAHSTLLYSPLISDKQAVDKILQLLGQSNWNVHSLQPLMANNHWFKKDSVGLYLVPDGVVPQNRRAKKDLAQQYVSNHCDAQISLVLSDDGEYRFTFTQPTETTEQFSTGTWRITEYPYIELVTEDKMWWFYFQVTQQKEVDKISPINVTRLQPMNKYRDLAACSFEFGVRV